MAIEETMAQMAHSQITQSLPSMTEDIQGFQIIDTNDDINAAIGVIVGLVGNMVVYVPTIYRKGKIYNMDIMYVPELRQWLPTHDNWLTYIRSRRADLEAVIKDRDAVAHGGKATNIRLDEPLMQIVKTASSDNSDVTTLNIQSALRAAGDNLVAQLTTPITDRLTLPNTPSLLSKCAASAPARAIVQALAEHATVGDALVQFYSDDELLNMTGEVIRALTVEPNLSSSKPRGSVKLLTSNSVEARDLSDEDKATILRDGAVISDTRGFTPTKVYKTRSNGSWISPGTSGLYELLKLDGKTVTAYVVCGVRRPDRCSGKIEGTNYVIPMDDGMARVAIEAPANILGQAIPIGDIDLTGGSTVSNLPPNRYIERLLVDSNGTALLLTAGGARHIGDGGDYVIKLDGGRVKALGTWDDSRWGDSDTQKINTIVEIPSSGKLRVYGRTLYVPESVRLFEVSHHHCCDVCCCDPLMDDPENKSKAPANLNLATFDEYLDAVQRRNKLIAVKVYNDPTGYVITRDDDRSDTMADPLSKTAAAVSLVTDFAISPKDAFAMLNGTKTGEATRYLMKIAADTNYKMLITDSKPSDIDRTSIDLNQQTADQHSRQDIARQLTEAGNSGLKEVVDVTVLRILSDDGSCVRLIQDMVPSLFTAMNTVGQLIFMLRAGTSMAESYGDLRADEMEKQFSKLMQRLGDAVIVLQQGRVGSIKDLLEGPLSDTLG